MRSPNKSQSRHSTAMENTSKESATRKLPREIAASSSHFEKQEWINTASIQELREFLNSVPPLNRDFELAKTELSVRLSEAARSPHWTVTPSFWMAFAATVFAAIAAWPVIQDWFRAQQPANKAPSFQLQRSNSAPVTAPATRTSSPVSFP